MADVKSNGLFVCKIDLVNVFHDSRCNMLLSDNKLGICSFRFTVLNNHRWLT